MSEDQALWVKSQYFPKPMKLIGTYWDDRPIYANLLDGVADLIKARIDSDNQCVILITGGTGSGKSTLAIQLMRKLEKDLSFEDTYIYSQSDLARKLKKEQAGEKVSRINWYDEGSVTLNSLNTTSRAGLRFSQFFDTMRFDHYVSIICMPDGSDMNGRISKHIDFLIKCPKQAPLWNFSAKGFFTVSKRIVYNSGKVWEEVMGTGIYRDIPPRIKNAYMSIKRERAEQFKKKIIEEIE